MSEGNWVRRSAIGLAALSTIYAVWAIWFYLDYQHHKAYERSQAASEYANPAYPYIEGRCGGVPYLWGQKCTPGDINAEQTERREKADLKAQQEMAQWALFLALLGPPGLIVSGVRLWAIIWTFREQRKLTYAQSVAFLSMIKGDIYKASTGKWVLKIVIENQGVTPAKDVQIAADIDYFDGEVDEGEPIVAYNQSMVSSTLKYLGPKSDDMFTLQAEPIFPAEQLFPTGPRGDLMTRIDKFGVDKIVRLRLRGVINFVDAFDNDVSVPLGAEVHLLWNKSSSTFYRRAIDWERQREVREKK